MKTTIDISDPLLEEARTLAKREGTTLRALVEQGLRRAIAEWQSPRFKLRDASVKGSGLNPELADAGWEEIRRLADRRFP